jgi:hypothetical protein
MQIDALGQYARGDENLGKERRIEREHQPLARLLSDQSIGEPDVRHRAYSFDLAQIVVRVLMQLSTNAGLHAVQRLEVLVALVGGASFGDELEESVDLFSK